MMQRTPTNQIICPVCGQPNSTTARVCGSCFSVLVEPAPPPSQPNAITTAPRRDPVPPQQEPIMPRPLRHEPRAARTANRPAHTLAAELRAIAQSSHTKQEGEDGKPWWMSWGIAPILLAFLGMIGFKGDNVMEHLTKDDDHPKRHGLFG